MGVIWIPGAERLAPSLPGGSITSEAPARAVWHTVEAPSGDPRMWTRMQEVLTAKSSEPHVLWDPVTDRLGQFLALNTSGRALKNDGNARTNRTGRVCIQIEVIAYAANPFTAYWKPGPNFRALMAAIRSWGIPDAWPAGAPPRFIASPPHNDPEDERDRIVWLTKPGHYGHSQVPGNTHGDPGAISPAALFAAARDPEDDMSPEDIRMLADLIRQDIRQDVANTQIDVNQTEILKNIHGLISAQGELLSSLSESVGNLTSAMAHLGEALTVDEPE